MSYVALKTLKWGDVTIAPGEPVPEEEGRNYASLLRTGRIAKVNPVEQMSDAELAEALKASEAKRAELDQQVTAHEDRIAELLGEIQELREQPPEPEADAEQDAGGESEQAPEAESSAEAEQSGGDGGESESEPAETETEPAEPVDAPDPMEGVKALGGGYYELPDGTKVRGRAAVDKALAEQDAGGE